MLPSSGSGLADAADSRGVSGLGSDFSSFRRDATRLGAAGPIEPFTLAFLDPPYRRGLAEKSLSSLAEGGWLLPGSLAVVEEAAEVGLSAPAAFETLQERDYGDTRLTFLRYHNGAL